MKRVYANIDSDKSISYMKNYDEFFSYIVMSQETMNMLDSLENPSISNWLRTHRIENISLGDGIICGVIE